MMHRFSCASALAFALCATACPPALAKADPSAARAAIDAQFAKDWPDLQALYQDLHSHPETAFRETRTADVWPSSSRPWAWR
jgi:hippurate hydrolase